MITAEMVHQYIKNNGPVLPTHVANYFNISTLFASAYLSELSSKKLIEVSSIKVGGSPLYYAPEQRHKLSEFKGNLHEKEQRTYEFLERNMVLEDLKLDLLDRVALRKMKDYAVPLNVTSGYQTKLFWKFFTVPDEEASFIIGQILNKEAVEQQRISQMQEQYHQTQRQMHQQAEQRPQEQMGTHAAENQEARIRASESAVRQETAETARAGYQSVHEMRAQGTEALRREMPQRQEAELEKDDVPRKDGVIREPSEAIPVIRKTEKPKGRTQAGKAQSIKKEAEEKKSRQVLEKPEAVHAPAKKEKEKKQKARETLQVQEYDIKKEEIDYHQTLHNDSFGKKIITYFEQKNIQVIFSEIAKKNSDIFGVSVIPSVLGELEYFFYAKNKKSVTEKDFKEAYAESSLLGYPLLFITTGKISKSAVAFADSKLKGCKIIELQ